MKRISQREARRLRKRLAELERAIELQRRSWYGEWIGGVDIGRTEWGTDHAVPVAIRTARKLNHAVVCLEDGGTVRYVALPHPKVD